MQKRTKAVAIGMILFQIQFLPTKSTSCANDNSFTFITVSGEEEQPKNCAWITEDKMETQRRLQWCEDLPEVSSYCCASCSSIKVSPRKFAMTKLSNTAKELQMEPLTTILVSSDAKKSSVRRIS